MTISRRAALHAMFIGSPALLCAVPAITASATPMGDASLRQLSPAGRALCARLVDRATQWRWAWIEPREHVLAGWSDRDIDRLQIAMSTGEFRLERRIAACLRLFGSA